MKNIVIKKMERKSNGLKLFGKLFPIQNEINLIL